jgi:hypothetical protein
MLVAAAPAVHAASAEHGSWSKAGMHALRALATPLPWLPIPLDIDPLLLHWFDGAKFRPIWQFGSDPYVPHPPSANVGSAGHALAHAYAHATDAKAALLPVSDLELPAAKKAHGLATFMRLGTADQALRDELPPSAAAVHAVNAQVVSHAGGGGVVSASGGGGESDGAVLVEAELILYGGT